MAGGGHLISSHPVLIQTYQAVRPGKPDGDDCDDGDSQEMVAKGPAIEGTRMSVFIISALYECFGTALCINGWLAGYLAGWLTGWMGGWPVGWLTRWLAVWEAGCLVGWLADWFVGWLFNA